MPYKQKDSANYWISYTDSAGRRIRKSAGTASYQDAKAQEQALRAQHHIAKRRTGGVGIDQVIAEYLGRESRLVPRNISIGRALHGYLGNRPAAEITPQVVYGYIDHRRQSETSDSTIKRELAVLSAAINEHNKRLGTEIPNLVRTVTLREPESRVRWITKAEAERLIANSYPLLQDFIQLGLYTGMRTGEMLGLEWDRVDFWRKTVRLEAHHTKANRSRTVPLHPIALRALYRRRMQSEGSVYVFPSHSPDKPVGSIKTAFNAACRRTRIEDYRPHDLRHTCAAWLVQAGVSLYEVRDILGHASIKQTEVYAHLAQENLVAAIERLG